MRATAVRMVLCGESGPAHASGGWAWVYRVTVPFGVPHTPRPLGDVHPFSGGDHGLPSTPGHGREAVLQSPERHRTRGASPITAAQYEELRAFDAALHVGQRVMIRWTQGHRFYAMPATITKVNPKSVLAAIDDAVYDREHGQATLCSPAGQVIKAPRLSAFKAWTVNNCVMPLELERG